MAKDDHIFLVLLLLLPKNCDYRYVKIYQFYTELATNLTYQVSILLLSYISSGQSLNFFRRKLCLAGRT